eukprot:2798141-Lingulodinium_polyedra.AAC.1
MAQRWPNDGIMPAEWWTISGSTTAEWRLDVGLCWPRSMPAQWMRYARARTPGGGERVNIAEQRR